MSVLTSIQEVGPPQPPQFKVTLKIPAEIHVQFSLGGQHYQDKVAQRPQVNPNMTVKKSHEMDDY